MASPVDTDVVFKKPDLNKTFKVSSDQQNHEDDYIQDIGTQQWDDDLNITSAVESTGQQRESNDDQDCRNNHHGDESNGCDVPNTQWLASDTPSSIQTDSLEPPKKLSRTSSVHPDRMNVEESILKKIILPIGADHYVKVERFLNETDRRYPVVAIQRNGNVDLRKVFILHFQEYEQIVNHLTTVLTDTKDMQDWDITMELKGSEQRRKYNSIKITSVDTFDGGDGTCHPRKIDIRYWFMKKEADTETNKYAEWIPTKAGVRISKDEVKCLIDLHPVLKERISTLFNLNYTMELVGDLLLADFNEKIPKKGKKSRIIQFSKYLFEMTLDGLRTILKNECKKTNTHKYLVNRKLSINDMYRYLKSIDGKTELLKYIDLTA